MGRVYQRALLDGSVLRVRSPCFELRLRWTAAVPLIGYLSVMLWVALLVLVVRIV